ncbi:metal-sulfur cluster assembly factor [Tardiphaga sp. 768_D3_N2_1]|uniref:metal-sulfur cluster assembly factor n=1 Tax=Tardiphaga sp. 768_D3_N2_1 TaxID=3240783 RepID=UPI003F8860F3
MTAEIINRIRDAMRIVIDPELGQNIVDLGFVYDITVVGPVARITMTTTSPGCPASSFLLEGARHAAEGVEGVSSVDVEMTFDPPWTPSRIDPSVSTSLGFATIN